MKLSIVIPTFNSEKYLEQTLESIKDQTYSNYEVLVADGGSTDETINIIKKYDFVKIVSINDNSQTDGLNKAMEKCTGDIVAWQNSDDIYYRTCFSKVAEAFESDSIDILYGSYNLIGVDGSVIKRCFSHVWNFQQFKTGRFVPLQPTLFWRKDVSDKIFPLDTSLKYCMDVDFMAKAYNSRYIYHFQKDILGAFRIHGNSKTSEWLNTKQVLNEHYQVLLNNFSYTPWEKSMLILNLSRTFMIKIVLNIMNKN